MNLIGMMNMPYSHTRFTFRIGEPDNSGSSATPHRFAHHRSDRTVSEHDASAHIFIGIITGLRTGTHINDFGGDIDRATIIGYM
jgi:hypothetical protein